MKQQQTAKELACKLVGDGKKPNKYFVTIGFGWYAPENPEEDMIQAKNSLESVTIGPLTSKAKAMELFNAIPIDRHIQEVTGETIGQICIEDRLTGVVLERRLTKSGNRFFIDQFA
jgi:hypothetical protein